MQENYYETIMKLFTNQSELKIPQGRTMLTSASFEISIAFYLNGTVDGIQYGY